MAQPANPASHTIRRSRQRSSSMYDLAPGTLGLFGATFPPPRPPKSKSRGNLKVSASPLDPNHPATPSTSESSPKSKRSLPSPSDPAEVTSSISPISIPPSKSRNASQVSLKNSPPNPEVERIIAQPASLRTKPKGARPRSSTISSAAPIPTQTVEESPPSGTFSSSAFGQSPVFLAYTKSGGKTSSSSSSPANLSPVKASPPQRRVLSKPSATLPSDSSKERLSTRRPGLRVINTTPRLEEVEVAPLSASLSDDSDSSANLSIPPFYSNPRASSSDKTMDTLSFALRSLAPAHTPTIDHLSPKILQMGAGDRGKVGSVVEARERKNSATLASSSPMVTTSKTGSKSRTPNATSTVVVGPKKSSGASTALKKTAGGSSKSITPLDSPSKRRTDFLAVTKEDGGEGVNQDHDDDWSLITPPSPPVATPLSASGPSSTKRKKQHGVPPPLKLAGSNFSKTGGKSTHRRSSRASSIIGTGPLSPRTPLSPRVPLSPALSVMSTVTIATLVGRPRRPTEKELRRRRFAKLTRTLGEEIPPELLVGSSVGKRRIEGGGNSGAAQRSNTIGGSKETKKRSTTANLGLPSRKKTTGVGSRWSGVFTGGNGGGGLDMVVRDTGGSTSAPISAAGVQLSTHFPLSTPLPGGDTSGAPSPNVLRKYGSLRRKRGMSDSSAAAVEVDVKPAKLNDHRAPGLAAAANDTQPPVAPYFEDHPFRIVVEDTQPTAEPSVASPDLRSSIGFDSYLQRDSTYSMTSENPWMRASLAIPMQYDSPFIEYAAAAFAGVNVNEVTVNGGRASTYLTPPPLEFMEHGTTGVYRKERRDGWSGEWNQPHIKDVIEKLRQL